MDPEYGGNPVLREALRLLAEIMAAAAIAWLVVASFGRSVINSGQSMQPLLESGESVLVDRISYHFTPVRRYDVIAFYLGSDDSAPEEVSIKRVLGLPGETVRIDGGQLFVNGRVPEGPEGMTEVDLAGLAASPIELGEGEYFVLGDNRTASEDSRFGSIGNIPRERMIGRVWLRIKPFSRFMLIKREKE